METKQLKSCRAYRQMAWDALRGNWLKTSLPLLAVYGLSFGLLFASAFVAAPFALASITLFAIVYYLVVLAASIAVVLPLQLGVQIKLLDLLRGEPFGGFSEIAQLAFSKPYYKKLIGIYLLTYLMVFLAFLPAFVGMALVEYSMAVFMILYLITFVAVFYVLLCFSMAFFLLRDHNEYSAGECLRASAELMKGRKGKLLKLMLSFIGWALLWYVALIVVVFVGVAIATACGMGEVAQTILLVVCILPVAIVCILPFMVYMTTAEAAFYNDLVTLDESLIEPTPEEVAPIAESGADAAPAAAASSIEPTVDASAAASEVPAEPASSAE